MSTCCVGYQLKGLGVCVQRSSDTTWRGHRIVIGSVHPGTLHFGQSGPTFGHNPPRITWPLCKGQGCQPATEQRGTLVTAQAVFSRQGEDVHATAASLLNLPAGERIRCFHLPMFEKAMGWSVHMYIDLDAIAVGTWVG